MKKWISFMLAVILVLSLGIPVVAADEYEDAAKMKYVVDAADLLTYDQWEELEAYAAEVSENYDCGVYVLTLDDYLNYGSGSVYEVTTQIYHNQENDFGMGDGRDGIMLLLSMEERDWAMFVYGDKAAYAFDGYGQKMLEGVFLDNFKENDWYGGFSDYLNTCKEYLEKAEAGKHVRKGPGLYIVISIGISVLIALLICFSQKQKMKTVHKKIQAGEYVAAGGVKLWDSFDRFTHTTETRRKIEDNSGSSGNSRSESGGGGSGRSGKF